MSLYPDQIDYKILKEPLKKPFRTALGEHKSLRNLLLTMKFSNGITSHGEIAVAPHIFGNTVETTKKQLDTILPLLKHKDLLADNSSLEIIHYKLKKHPPIIAGLEMAILDGLCQSAGMPLWNFFGAHLHKIRTSITLVIDSPMSFQSTAQDFFRQGFRKFKIKIGTSIDRDMKNILSIKPILKKSSFYLDANQGFNARESLKILRELKSKGLRPEFIEQPVKKNNLEGLAHVKRESSIPVCADESLSSIETAKKIIRCNAADIFNIKLAKLGIFEAFEIAYLAKRNNITLMMGMMMESPLGVLAGAQFAAGIGGFRYIDLDTPYYFKRDLKHMPFLNKRGHFKLSQISKGIGYRSELA